MESLDLKILKILNENGRRTHSEVARALGVSAAGVQQHVQKMLSQGTIQHFQPVISPQVLGYEACALVCADIPDRRYVEKLVDQLMAIPTITECHFTTGHHDIMLTLYGRNNDDIFNQLLRLQQIGLSNTETIISFRCQFKRPLPIPDPE